MGFFHRHPWLCAFVGAAGLFAAVAFMFRMDWLVPLAEARATAALGRPVSIAHLRIRLDELTRIEMDGVVVGNPPDWPGGGVFATVSRVVADVQLVDWLQDRQLVVPNLALSGAAVEARRAGDGRVNWVFSPATPADPGSEPRIGTVRLESTTIHLVDAQRPLDLVALVSTRELAGGGTGTVAEIRGRLATQEIVAQAEGGPVLAFLDSGRAWPIDVRLAQDETRLALTGTLRIPLAVAGAEMRVDAAGPDLAALGRLFGSTWVSTDAYRVSAGLRYADGVAEFDGVSGQIGQTDVSGTLKADLKGARPALVADLDSMRLLSRDLAGLLAAPVVADVAADGNGAPNPVPATGITWPPLDGFDLHLRYRAERVLGAGAPFENLVADIEVVRGVVEIRPFSVGLGRGQIIGDAVLSPSGTDMRAQVSLNFNRVALDRLRAATGFGRGAGLMGGRLSFDGTGRSTADFVSRGSGDVRMFVSQAGDIGGLLQDLGGGALAAPVLASLGVPARTPVQCAALDALLQRGLLKTRLVQFETEDYRIGVRGEVDLAGEIVSLAVDSEARRPGATGTGAVDVRGTVAQPQVVGVALRTAGSASSMASFPSTALPTVPFSTGDDQACLALLRNGPVRIRP